jgi:hypothetical protein
VAITQRSAVRHFEIVLHCYSSSPACAHLHDPLGCRSQRLRVHSRSTSRGKDVAASSSSSVGVWLDVNPSWFERSFVFSTFTHAMAP